MSADAQRQLGVMPQQHSLALLDINADVLLPDLYITNMSSGIEKNVPLFTGDDYPGWSVSMESYLMASGVWHVIDDFILLAVFVGNDFLPNLPDLHIHENGLEKLFDVYKKALPSLGE